MHLLAAPPPEFVGFDLDGTLVDSAPDLAWCIDRTMPRFGIAPRGEALVRDWIGDGVQRLVERALTGESDARADPALLGEACAVFLDLYSEHGRDRSRVYPGVREGLAAMRARGAALACITNKPHAPRRRAARAPRAARRLRAGAGRRLARAPRSPIRCRCAMPAPSSRAAVERSVFVGDSVNDVTAARAAGMRVACVSYGYNHGRDISETAPDAVVDSLDELAALCFGAPETADGGTTAG